MKECDDFFFLQENIKNIVMCVIKHLQINQILALNLLNKHSQTNVRSPKGISQGLSFNRTL